MEEEKKKGNKIFINIFLVLIFLCVGLYLYASYVEPNLLIHNEYKIENENIPLNFSGIKIVHVSDLFFGNTNLKYVEKLVNEINLLNPDLVIFSGNLISKNKKMTDKDIEKLSSYLNKIESTLGKYAVKGDHDYIDNYEKVIEKTDFIVLTNNYELIYNEGLTPIYLSGCESYNKKKYDVNAALKDSANYYSIFVSHESDIIDEVLKDYSNVNLILSSGTLGGIINIPFYGEIVYQKGCKKYYSPSMKRGDSEIFISNGVGTNKYLYRFNNKPSFNLYRLKSIQ